MKSSGEQKSQIYPPVSVREQEGLLFCKLGYGSSPRCKVKMMLVKSCSYSHTCVQRPPLRKARWSLYTWWPLYTGQLCRKYKATGNFGKLSGDRNIQGDRYIQGPDTQVWPYHEFRYLLRVPIFLWVRKWWRDFILDKVIQLNMDFKLKVTLSPSVYQRTFRTLRAGKCLSYIFWGIRKKKACYCS